MPGKLMTSQLALVVLLGATCTSLRPTRADDAAPTSQPVNLALNKPASASATESDEHDAAKANDGDDDTRWCADGDSTPQWWQVDLEKPATLTGIQIKWEFDEKVYKYVVEGSADNTTWKTLSDQSATTVSKQVQSLTFDKPAEGIRYVRIRITGLEDGCWASMFEVKVLGK
jgi:alpha-L-fucosidase